jgi:hypothetical protein
MLKNGKKNLFISNDTFNFFVDKIKSIIYTQDELGNIKNNNDTKIKFYTNNFDIQNKKYFGSFVCEGTIENINSAISTTTNKNIKNAYFTFDKHYEENVEIPTKKIEQKENKLKFGVNFTYNKYVKRYEQFLDINKNLSEKSLPDYYQIVEEYYKANSDKEFKNIDPLIAYNNPQNNIDLNFVNKFIVKNYFDSKIGLKNEYFSLDKYLNNFNVVKDRFPFYCNIYIDAHDRAPNGFAQFFHDNRLFKELLLFIDSNNNNEKIYSKSEENVIFNSNIKTTVINDIFKQKVIDLTSPDVLYSFFSRVDEKYKNFLDIKQNNESYSEVIGYKLAKFDGLGLNSEPLEETFIPNITEYSYEIIDSQIKYDKNYKYKLVSLVMVIGNEYEYTSIEKLNDTSLKATFVDEPKIYIYQIDSAEFTNRLLDKPPVEPEVEFLPYLTANSKIKINFTNKPQVVRKTPIPFSENESIQYQKFISLQNSFDGKINFKNDELYTQIFIYRLEKEPKNIDEFFNNLTYAIQIDNEETITFQDTIDLNKKYYYIFRSLDDHGHISNPTDVFEVNLSEGKILSKVINIDLNPKQSFKPFRKFLKISPSTGQKIASNIGLSGASLGVNSDSLWNKNFKIRLISKNSNKKIDLNVSFGYETINNKR